MLSNFYFSSNEKNGSICASVTRTFDSKEIEDSFIMESKVFEYIDSIKWSISSVGYVKLFWENSDSSDITIPFVILSGNGSWSLSGSSICSKPTNSSGRIRLISQGFDDLDAFTIIITGKIKW
jgi:hypothetical protein